MFTFRRLLILSVILFFGWISWTIPARASVPLNDQLEATETCEAFQSFRRRTNPGNIQLTPGQIYPVTAKNKDDATHYYLRIDDAEPTARWVSTSCGNLLGTPPVGDITSSNPAFHYFENPHLALAEIKRIIKPNGRAKMAQGDLALQRCRSR